MKIKLKGYNPNSNSNPSSVPPTASTSALPLPLPAPRLHQQPPVYPHLQPGPPPVSAHPVQPAQRNDGPFASQQRFFVNHATGQLPSQAQPGSPSGSSRASDDFLNAPLPLPDSSGDEYEEDDFADDGSVRTGMRRKHLESDRQIRSRTGDSTEPAQFFELPQVKHREQHQQHQQQQSSDGMKRGRGRPPKVSKEKDRDGAFHVRLWNPNKGKARASVDAEGGAGDDSMDVDEEGSQADFDQEGQANTSMNDSRDPSQAPGSGASTPNMFYSDGKKKQIGTPTGRNDRQRTTKTKGNGLAPDEANLPIDAEGEKKIDAAGNLLGGRQYKASTFVSTSKKNAGKVYMLAIDAARCAGFRDSLYFFRRNPWINKINCSQEEKETLINVGRLHTNLKSRQVTIVSAGNCFRVFGARFVKNGKNVIDDYYEAAALAKGLIPGSPAYSESYDPEIDNTTLAMPKVGGFAAKRGPGRPAYMKIAEAFEMAGATPAMTPDGQSKLPVPKPAKIDGGAESSDEDDGKGGRRRKKGWRFRKDKQSPYNILRVPKAYNATVFGTVGGQATPQFGGNGQAPFGEQWEKSKARKPAPHLNGYNWMSEYAKITRERNRAYLHLAKSYSAHHSITLGKTLEKEVEEERAGMWELSGSEGEYESLQEYKKREKIVSGDEDDEPDERKRGRSPAIADTAKKSIKAEAGDDSIMNVDAVKEGEAGTEPAKKRRRRRSPVRGFYDEHTRLPQVRLETQPTALLSYDWQGAKPQVHLPDDKADARIPLSMQQALLRAGLATIEYSLEYPPKVRDILTKDEENVLLDV